MMYLSIVDAAVPRVKLRRGEANVTVCWERAVRTRTKWMEPRIAFPSLSPSLPFRIAGQDRCEIGFMQLFVHLCAARNSLFTASARARLRSTVPMR